MSNIQPYLGVPGWPICDVCNKPVERMETFNDPLSYTRTFRASCHGQTQQVQVSDQLAEEALAMKFIRAFVQVRIGGEA